MCVSVCMFSIEIQTAGHSGIKFGTQVVQQAPPGPPNLVGQVTFLDLKSRSGGTWAPCPSGAMNTHTEG